MSSVRWSEDDLERLRDDESDARVRDPRDEKNDVRERVRFSVTAVPPTLNELLRMHWSDVQDQKDTWAALVGVKVDSTVRTPVRITYVRQSSGRMDLDNLYASLKVPLDGLVHAGILPDDDPESVSSIRAKQRQGDPRTILTLTHDP